MYFCGIRSSLIFFGREARCRVCNACTCFHVFLEKDRLSFSVQRKNIMFFGGKNTIFPDNTRKIIFQRKFFEKTIFSEDLRKIWYFHIFFWERSPFIFRPKKKYHVFGEKNTIFPDNTRKIIFQGNFFKKTIFSEHLKIILYFHVFFEKDHLSFSVQGLRSFFREKKKIIFPDNTRKIIFQPDFFWKAHLFRSSRKRKYGFPCSEANLSNFFMILLILK